MKGIVFREFLEMIEERFGYAVVDQMIESASINSKGIYTTVGTYPHAELFKLAEQFSLITNIPMSQIFIMYGEYVFESFLKTYTYLQGKYPDALTFLSNVQNAIHVEVLKLYPDAELPGIEIIEHSGDYMLMEYTSNRKMGYFAEGLIRGCFNHYNEKVEIDRKILVDDETKILFAIRKIYG